MGFTKLLIANRGEIAVRIIRACREMGVKSVAVYSEADANAMHVREADESYLLGPSAASESYLNIGRLIESIEDSGAEAVHPGYGFLAESAEFARAVEGAGAVWVGPSPEAMEAMGFKVRAKEIARKANVPTVPGYEGGGAGEDESMEKLSEEAERIGYPVLVKASAGGGGRGMRAVHAPGNLTDAVEGARREAVSAFGDGSVFLEKLVEEPRHIEVQIVGDSLGNVIHLFERECSIQRRHQKVVEESPSPALTAEMREEICAAAVRLAKEVGYRNAGTVEFLLDKNGEFYFLEMNARLQVEHPVTELVTGLDLVQLQLAAAGEPLPMSQEGVSINGSSIEVRVYAEDDNGLPAGGRLLAFDPPEGPGVRNDSGVESGDEVSLDYDSMISKLIVHAPTRSAAVRRLKTALDNHTILGVPTNLPLLKRISAHPAFAAGETTTDFLEKHNLLEAPEEKSVPNEVFALAAACEAGAARIAPEPFEAGNWRQLGASQTMYSDGGELRRVVLSRRGKAFGARIGEKEYSIELLSRQGETFHALLDGRAVKASVAEGGGATYISLGGEEYEVRRAPPPNLDDLDSGGAAAGGGLVAPMPGTVVKVMVEEGDEVEEGRRLLVLEAMKMEQPVSAPYAGVVKSLPFGEGDMVPGGATLVEVEET